MRLIQSNAAATLEAVRSLSENAITVPQRKAKTIPIAILEVPHAPEPPDVAYLKTRKAWLKKTSK